MKFLGTLVLLSSILFISPYLFSETVYKVKDKDGVVTYTNVNPSEEEDVSIIESNSYSAKVYDENNYLIEPQTNKKKQTIHDVDTDTIFRNKAIELRDKELRLKREIKYTKRYIKELKEKIDDLLIDGYFADHDIFEMKRQESILTSLEKELSTIDDDRLTLKREARKNGVEPGVLRVN